VSISATGKQRIIPIGPTDSLNLVGQLQNAMFGKGPLLEVGSDRSIYNRAALPTLRQSLPDNLPLPPYKVAKGYFAAQYTYIGTIFSFVNPSRFDEQLQIALLGPPNPSDADECLSYANVLIILAFGQLYSVNQWVRFSSKFHQMRIKPFYTTSLLLNPLQLPGIPHQTYLTLSRIPTTVHPGFDSLHRPLTIFPSFTSRNHPRFSSQLSHWLAIICKISTGAMLLIFMLAQRK
jgi:hypothetical protein